MRSRARRRSRLWLSAASALALLAAVYWLLREECPPEECLEDYLASEDLDRLSAGLYAAGRLEDETHAERVRALARTPLASELSEELVYVGRRTGDVVLLDQLARARLEPDDYCSRCLTVGEDSGHPDFWPCRALTLALDECSGSSESVCEPYAAFPSPPWRQCTFPSSDCNADHSKDVVLGCKYPAVVARGLWKVRRDRDLFEAYREDVLRLARSPEGRKVASDLEDVGTAHRDLELLDAVARMELDPAIRDGVCAQARQPRLLEASCQAARAVWTLCRSRSDELCRDYRQGR